MKSERKNSLTKNFTNEFPNYKSEFPASQLMIKFLIKSYQLKSNINPINKKIYIKKKNRLKIIEKVKTLKRKRAIFLKKKKKNLQSYQTKEWIQFRLQSGSKPEPQL